jgi:hypothetical protein
MGALWYWGVLFVGRKYLPTPLPLPQCESRRNMTYSGQGGIVKERKTNVVIIGGDLDPKVWTHFYNYNFYFYLPNG